jgi:hypothetical protein
LKDTVAIVGSHPKTRTEFDFTRTDCDIWVFNEALSNPSETWCPRADAVFQMHAPVIWKNPKNRNHAGHYDWLKTQTETVVYMQDKYDDVPKSVRFPLEDVFQGLHFNKRYITSSVAYALALAASMNYKKIELYGVEMETDTEYRYQRDGVALWVGVALGRGIEVELHCGMLSAPLYGYEGDVKIDYKLFTDKIEEVNAKQPDIEAQYNEKMKATSEKIKHFMETGKDGGEIVKAVQEQLHHGIQFGQLDGVRQENERYKDKADTMIAASGEFIFSRQEFEAARQALNKKQVELMQKSNVLAGQVDAAFKRAEKVKNKQRRKKVMTDFIKMMDAYIKTTITTAMIVGAIEENTRLLNILDEKIKAAGGSKSEEVMLEAYANRS